MARKHFTSEQIIRKLRDAEILVAEDLPTAHVVNPIGIPEQKYYCWRKK